MKSLLIDHTPFQQAKLTITENKDLGGGKSLVTLVGKLQEAEQKNGNGRVYPREILEREVKKYAENEIDDKLVRETRMKSRGHNTPLTKEEVLYRTIFWRMYGKDNDHLISEIWRPKWTTVKDPSARLLIEKNPK